MLKNQENNVGGKSSPVWSFIKKNATTIIMVFIVGLIFFNPNAKSFFIRQLMHTGLFNARIDSKNTTALSKESSYFQYEDERGNIYNTESLRGKVVFINFWASWCGPCIAEFPSIETLYTEYKDHLGIEFLLLNEDN